MFYAESAFGHVRFSTEIERDAWVSQDPESRSECDPPVDTSGFKPWHVPGVGNGECRSHTEAAVPPMPPPRKTAFLKVDPGSPITASNVAEVDIAENRRQATTADQLTEKIDGLAAVQSKAPKGSYWIGKKGFGGNVVRVTDHAVFVNQDKVLIEVSNAHGFHWKLRYMSPGAFHSKYKPHNPKP